MAKDNYIPKIGDENRIDNKERTMRGAIAGLMETNGRIRIASGYFRLSGITELEEDFRDFFSRSADNKIELLISNKYDTKKPETRAVLEEGTKQHSTESFYLDNQFYQQLIEWIRTNRLEVKIFVDEKFYETHKKSDIAFLHGKAYMFSETSKSTTGSVLIGSSNFTYGGLVANRELNIFSSDSFPPLKNWFDEMWEEYSEKYSEELIADLENQKEKYAKEKVAYTPIKYFYWNLGKYFGKKSSETLVSRIKEIEKILPYSTREDGKKYFSHQFYGIQHVYEGLKTFDTQVLADGVGLGKTLEAASIIKLYLQDLSLENDKRRVLILANERLREQWQEELKNVGVDSSKYDMKTRQAFTNMSGEELHQYAENYALVIIDEAHEGFLRKGNKVYQNMQEMISYARDTQSRTLRGLLLTATPWNNSREDVIRLGLLFLNLQKVPIQRPYYNYLLTKRENLLYDTKNSGNYNQEAYVEFWKDLFYQRTRASLASDKYLSDRYPTREFPLETSEEPFTIDYSPKVSQALNEILEQLIDLKLPYQDTIWQYFGPNKVSNVILRQRFQLLRIADSSNAAFGASLQNIKIRLEYFEKDIRKLKSEPLSQVKKYFYSKVSQDYAENIAENENGFDFGEELESEFLNKSQTDRIKFIDDRLTENSLSEVLNKMSNDTEKDIQNLEEIMNSWQIVSEHDEKRNFVIAQVKKIVSRGEKVLLFSEFAETSKDYFKKMVEDKELQAAGVGLVHGGGAKVNLDESTKRDVLGRFSPISKSYELFDKSEISVLIGTDAISTGQNLQDASNIMTIELPYNPMRLEQRIGRVDRPKNKGENKIFVYAFPSEEIISAELKLSDRFESKAKGATTDTEGEFKLPFVHGGEFKGIIDSLIHDEKTNNVIQDKLIASVSDYEARERVREFYEKIGENFVNDKDFYAFPYSFSTSEQKFLLAEANLKDINGTEIQNTEPQIWKTKDFIEKVDFVIAESQIKKLLEDNRLLEKLEVDSIINQNYKKEKTVLNQLVSEYNKDLKNVSELEQQPAYVSDIRKQLLDNMRSFRNNFSEQSVDGKEFRAIAKSLNNRGFSAEQKIFLKNLRDENGQLSTLKMEQNIWKNLDRFMEIFSDNVTGETLIQNRKARASIEQSVVHVIAGIL
ncbi:helicase-related protein [Lactococcus petauri]|uniref:helicase-related protein n=1 Tax=Lactococcus petauri TaxID=1940789 RepID=UPI003853B60E